MSDDSASKLRAVAHRFALKGHDRKALIDQATRLDASKRKVGDSVLSSADNRSQPPTPRELETILSRDLRKVQRLLPSLAKLAGEKKGVLGAKWHVRSKADLKHEYEIEELRDEAKSLEGVLGFIFAGSTPSPDHVKVMLRYRDRYRQAKDDAINIIRQRKDTMLDRWGPTIVQVLGRLASKLDFFASKR